MKALNNVIIEVIIVRSLKEIIDRVRLEGTWITSNKTDKLRMIHKHPYKPHIQWVI